MEREPHSGLNVSSAFTHAIPCPCPLPSLTPPAHPYQRFLVDLIGVVMEGVPDHLIPGVPYRPHHSNTRAPAARTHTAYAGGCKRAGCSLLHAWSLNSRLRSVSSVSGRFSTRMASQSSRGWRSASARCPHPPMSSKKRWRNFSSPHRR